MSTFQAMHPRQKRNLAIFLAIYGAMTVVLLACLLI